MPPSFAAVRERYLDDLVANKWYDVRTFGKKQRQASPTGLPSWNLSGNRRHAVEMHSPQSAPSSRATRGGAPASGIAAGTRALFK